MAIDKSRIEKMKKLVEDAKKTKTIVPSEKAFEVCPPEGIWEKNENDTIAVKEINSI